MPREIELREGEEAAERFKELTAKIMSVPKTAIDERAKEKREGCDNREQAEE